MNNLDHLEHQAAALLEWVKAKREGRKVAFQIRSSLDGNWSKIIENVDPNWKIDTFEYRLIYPEEERNPKKGDIVLVRGISNDLWQLAFFLEFHENGSVYVSHWYKGNPSHRYEQWKWPDYPKTEEVEKKIEISDWDKSFRDPKQASGMFKDKYKESKPKKLIPLEANDWVGGPWFVRHPVWSKEAYSTIISITKNGFHVTRDGIGHFEMVHYEHAFHEGWLRSRDCLEWFPCSKEEV